MNRSGTVNTPNRGLTTFSGNMAQKPESDARGSKLSRLIDWLGSARRINADINDEMATLKFEVELLRMANKRLRSDNDSLLEAAEGWKETSKSIGRERAAAINELAEAKPLIAYALKRKASLAKHDKKRGRAHG